MRLFRFVSNANCVSLFAMEVEKLIVNGKVTARLYVTKKILLSDIFIYTV